MREILNMFNQIQATNSRNEKEVLFEQFKDNVMFKEILKFVYDPYIVTGLSAKKIKKKVKDLPKIVLLNVEQVMEYLREFNTGRDQDISVIQEFISRQPESQRELITQIVTKSLKIGSTANTMNKVYGEDFIPSFDVMLADKYFEHPDKVIGEFIITEKLDGMRCVIIKDAGNTTVFSRQGQPIEDLVEILEESKKLQDLYVYDGELILKNDKGLVSKDLYRETIKVARKDGEKKNLIFNCFDIIPVEDFKKGKCDILCSKRKDHIGVILNDYLEGTPLQHIIEVPILYKGTDKEQIIKLLDEAIAKGQEGVMINMSNAPYSCKRTKDILKVKKMQDCDLRVVSVEEGEGRNKGTLGRVNVEYKNNTVGVGSGFNDAMRTEVFNNPEKYIGKIAKIQFFEETTNSKDDKVSLRFPVFIEWRTDKMEPSYF
jgi:DNA ligase-1